MNTEIHNQPLGILRPHNEHMTHQIKIVLESADGRTAWSTILNLGTQPDSDRKFYLIELPAAVRPPGATMRQLDNGHSELSVPLADINCPPIVHDLSEKPLEEWMVTMFSTFARCSAAVAVLCNQGRVSTVLHGGEPL